VAYTKKQRADKGFDFFDDKGKKITIEQYTQATGANGSNLRQELAKSGDKTSQNIIRNDALGKLLVGVRDFAAGANEAAFTGASKTLAALFTPVKIGESKEATKKRTEDIAKIIVPTNDKGVSPLGQNANLDSTAGMVGQAVGETGKIATEVASSALPGAAAEKAVRASSLLSKAIPATNTASKITRTVVPAVAGGAVSTAINQLEAPEQDAAQNFATGAAIDIGTSLLGPAASAASRILKNPASRQEATNIAKQIVKAPVEVVNQARPSVIAAQDPRVMGFDDQYTSLAQQFDNTADTASRQAISKAMAMNRVERLNTQKRVQREIGEGGYVKLPGNDATPELPQTPESIIPNAAPQVDIPRPTRQSQFAAQTAPNSGNLSDELAQRVRQSAPDYDPVTNKGSLEDSVKYLADTGVDNASSDVLSRLDSPTASSKDISDGLATATALDLRGDETSLRLATEIYDKLSASLTKAGQTVQAAKLINRRTGQGLLFDAQRQLTKADVKILPEQRQALQELANRVDNTVGEEKTRVIAEVQREVNKLIPSDLVDKVVGTWKAGLLTGIRTTTGGALSNALFRGLREASRPGAVAADMVASLFTGKRSSVLTQKGVWSGTGEGLVKAGKYLKSGVDERAFTADGKYIDRELNFKNKALQTYVNGVFRVMGAADRPFYYSQFKNSIAEATIVEAKNLKLKGKDFDAYVENGLKNPSDDAAQYATDVANQAVLANDTLLSNGVNGVRQSIEKLENPIVRGGAKFTLGILAPFTKVPSAFLSRVIDFTPLGAIKEVALQAGKKQLNQAKLVQAISEAGTGTGLIYLGAVLANEGLLTGNYPNDPKEAARWKAEGIIPNAIKVGDTYYSLNYAGPVGALFNVGKAITDASKEGADAVAAAIAGGTQLATGTLEQSFLSGISGALDAIQDPQRYAANFVKSQAGSVIPTLLNDIGNATDETQRQANTAGEAILSRIPGARTVLNAKSDAFGNELTQANDSPIGRLVDPLRPSNAIESPLTDELGRLKEAGQFIYPLTDKTIKAGGETIKLDADQQKTFNDGVGQETQLIWSNIINSPEYQALSDEEKKETLANAQTDISAVGKKQFLESIQNQATADKITYTKRQEKYAAGTIDPTLWIPGDNIASTSPTKKKTDTANDKKTGSKKTGSKKTSGSRRVGFKAPKSGAFKRTQSTAALRKLLQDAGKKLS